MLSKTELHLILEALRSAEVEISGLIEEDIYVPSGDLVEQLKEAVVIVGAEWERECDGLNGENTNYADQ